MDVDEANDITVFRYKKFTNKQFRLNVIIDI